MGQIWHIVGPLYVSVILKWTFMQCLGSACICLINVLNLKKKKKNNKCRPSNIWRNYQVLSKYSPVKNFQSLQLCSMSYSFVYSFIHLFIQPSICSCDNCLLWAKRQSTEIQHVPQRDRGIRFITVELVSVFHSTITLNGNRTKRSSEKQTQKAQRKDSFLVSVYCIGSPKIQSQGILKVHL